MEKRSISEQLHLQYEYEIAPTKVLARHFHTAVYISLEVIIVNKLIRELLIMSLASSPHSRSIAVSPHYDATETTKLTRHERSNFT